MEQIRSFIAIALGQDLKRELAETRKQLDSPPKPWMKWVEPESIHITLKFLGDTPVDKIEAIKAAMEEAAVGISPFTLKAGGLGVFPNASRAQVVWVGLNGDTQKLSALQQKLEKELDAIGFPAENRRFSAHLTLGRVRREATTRQRQEIGRLAATMDCRMSSEIAAKSICLMKSKLTPRGPIYSLLAEVPLFG